MFDLKWLASYCDGLRERPGPFLLAGTFITMVALVGFGVNQWLACFLPPCLLIMYHAWNFVLLKRHEQQSERLVEETARLRGKRVSSLAKPNPKRTKSKSGAK